ncbi:MAG: GntR family transcriptional regulator [Anaerolineae bacterium]|nr:GntR family transcriptional regulator [Anaerolineae bacterium]
MDQPTKATSQFQTMYQEIRDRICLLQYPPGTMLSENKLAAEFGVSRTPIRRVLQRLEFEGLVVSKQGIGTLVTIVDLQYLKEVYALRLKLAELTGELSPIRPTQETVATLETILEKFEAMRDQYDPTELARLYNQFQAEMLAMIGNRPLREISEQLYHQTARVWLQILPDLDWEEEVDIACRELSDVIGALKEKDMQAMAHIRSEHMAMVLGRMSRYLGGTNAR